MSSNMPLHVIVVGGGASGLMAAGTAASKGFRVTIVEKKERPARKILVTGKGRCNVTNNCSNETLMKNIPVNSKFLFSTFQQFNSQDTIDFFERLGVPLKTERGNRVFPVSDKAMDIVDALVKFVKKNQCKIVHGTVKELLIDNDVCDGVKLIDGSEIHSDAVIICTGGLSYPGTGSTGDGYEFAKQIGHSIVELKPSLVPLCSNDSLCLECQGLSLKNVSIKLFDSFKNKEIYSDFGELLFTHFGLSGPLILSASSHMREQNENRYCIHLDLKPAMSFEMLDARILRDMIQYKNLNLQNALIHLMPKSLINPVLERADLSGEIKCHSLTKDQRLSLVKTIKDIVIEIQNTRPISEAVITSGGINTREINPKTMQSKLISNISFAGEIIDVDAYTGGFNLQIAFSTGFVAGKHILEGIE